MIGDSGAAAVLAPQNNARGVDKSFALTIGDNERNRLLRQQSRATATTPSRAKRFSCPADIFHRREKFATILEIPPTM